METIDIAHDFSATPGGRFNRDGPYSGEAFRDRILEPAVKRGATIRVVLDHVAGLPSSFLEEAFGGLIRAHRADAKSIVSRFSFVATEPDLLPYVSLIERYMREAVEH
jgi:hypothetical protein